MIDADAWNDLLEKVAYARPLTFSAEGSATRRHPWQLSPSFNAEQKRWECFVEPGYVNGEDVEMAVAASDAPEITRERLVGSKASTLRAWLSEEPRLVLGATRVIGQGSSPTGVAETKGGGFLTVHESVPLFFRALGVGESRPAEVLPEGSTETPVTTDESAPSPILRASDIVLRKPRAGTQSAWTGYEGGFQLNIVSTFTELNRAPAFVFSTARYTPLAEVPPLTRLLGEVAEAPFDELHIGTVYLLSPPGEDAEKEPDDTWMPFPQNRVFWNLGHRARAIELLPQASLNFPLPLAGGVAQPTVDEILAIYNAAQNQILATLSRTDASGAFWST